NDGNAADLHFSNADLIGANITGLCSWTTPYSSDGTNVVSFTGDAWVYLDSIEFIASNSAPTPGTAGFQVLLHELGHAMGLKHPFEGAAQLPQGRDNTQFTLMSYTQVGGPYSTFSPYDIAALKYLYGGDGIGGALGAQGSGALYLVGSEGNDNITGTGG